MSIRPKYKLSYVNFDSWGKRYVTGGGGGRSGVTACDRGGGVKVGQKKRYVIFERPHVCSFGA